jgi:hypothetical protein
MVQSYNLSKETLVKISKDFKKTKPSIEKSIDGSKITYYYETSRNFDEVFMCITEYFEDGERSKVKMEYGTMDCANSQYFKYGCDISEKQFIKLVRYNLDFTTELLGIYPLEKGIK